MIPIVEEHVRGDVKLRRCSIPVVLGCSLDRGGSDPDGIQVIPTRSQRLRKLRGGATSGLRLQPIVVRKPTGWQ